MASINSTLSATSTHPRSLGILGGVSWASTSRLYDIVHKLYQHNCVPFLPEVHLISLDFRTIVDYQQANNSVAIQENVYRHLRGLNQSDVCRISICSNTITAYCDPMILNSLGCINIADSIGLALSLGSQRVGVIGTSFYADFIRSGRVSYGDYEYIFPSRSEQEIVDLIIYNRLCKGIITNDDAGHIHTAVLKLADSGADKIVLACTELTLFDNYFRSQAVYPYIIDSLQECAKHLISTELGDQP